MKYLLILITIMLVGCATPLTPEEQKVVGSYEAKVLGKTLKWVFLDNGIVEFYNNGKKQQEEDKWKIVEGELHIDDENGHILVSRINSDGSITDIILMDNDGKREEVPKEEQTTFKKIK